MFLAEKVHISACINQAYARMKALLFPFNLQKWLTLGLCAWVLTLGEAGGGSGGRGFDKAFGKTENNQTLLEMLNTIFWGEGSVFERFAKVFDTGTQTIQIIFWGAVLLLLVVITLSIVVAYFQGRLRFVWLDNLLNNRAQLQRVYREYEEQGVDFFKGKLFIDIWYYVIALCLAGATLYPGIRYLRESARLGEWCSFNSFLGTGIILGAILVLLNIAVTIYLACLFTFTPLMMYKHDCSFDEAWRLFNDMLSQRKIEFVKYIVCNWMINMAAGVLLMFLLLCSCCILAIPLALPVIGATILLPWYVMRSYFAIEFYEKLTEE